MCEKAFLNVQRHVNPVPRRISGLRGVDLLPGCVCQKVREMGPFLTLSEGIEGPSKWV